MPAAPPQSSFLRHLALQEHGAAHPLRCGTRAGKACVDKRLKVGREVQLHAGSPSCSHRTLSSRLACVCESDALEPHPCQEPAVAGHKGSLYAGFLASRPTPRRPDGRDQRMEICCDNPCDNPDVVTTDDGYQLACACRSCGYSEP
jgi:hypothetical protein